jgi:serine/threonine-protein kinase
MDEGELPFVDACEIIRQIARALEAAHAKGIIHRDLKPENVFLKTVDDEKPIVKLLDFGLAKSTRKDDDAGNVAKTRSGQMLGTPLYMSPEQCKSKGVDHRTDIYALGCMCFELLVGRTPYDADNIAEIITAHLVSEPPRPSTFRPDIDPDLDKLLYGMIQKDPAKRPPLGEVRRILGMQVSKATGNNPFAHVASSPFVTPLPSTAVPPATGQLAPIRFPMQPPKTDPGVASTIRQAKPFTADTSLSDEDMLKAIKTPRWYFFVAVLVLVGVVAILVVLK